MTITAPVRILGVGNVLMGDDAFGPYVIRVLESRFEFPDTVEVIDAGTPGLDFTPYIDSARSVIVIDTVTGDEAPGTVKTYDLDQLLAAPLPARTNPHQPGLREALMAAELTDTTPQEILIVGVVPESTETGARLSAAVRQTVDRVVEMVVKELDRLGRPPTQRSSPVEPDFWWE
jgi:hydrogenase maturation protease